jgi:DNA processing protein
MTKEIIKQNGGLLTQRSEVKQNQTNIIFRLPNRIVAGVSDATIVIETDIKSRNMITAEPANG